MKPIALARWLATLVLPPPRGTPRRLLIPFSGSGSEIIGALRAGWERVEGIERDSAYIEIATARIRRWEEAPETFTEGEVLAAVEKADERQTTLFGKTGAK